MPDASAISPKISVIVPHYSDLQSLDRCLEALEKQSIPRSEFEVIVGDNNSPEGEDAVARTINGRGRLVVIRDRGPGPARNGAVAMATGEILAFTDCDCRPHEAWLSGGLKALETSDFVGGRMRVVVEDESNVKPVEAFERVFAFRNDKYVALKKFTVTANMFCPRAIFETVGGFHPGKVSEDEEWCQRAVAKGYRIGYAPGAVVDHPARRTWAELLKKLQRLDREYYELEVKAKGRRLKWLLNTLALPFSAVAHSRSTLLSRDLRTPRQRLDATAILFRQRWWRFVTQLRLLAGLA